MVNIEQTPFGGVAVVVGGGPGNYTGYGPGAHHISGSSPDTYHPLQRLNASIQPLVKEGYRARQLQTTNLETEYKNLPKLTNLPYLAHGLAHQGQLRPRRSRVFNFPRLPSDSTSRSPASRETRTQSRSGSRQRSTPESKTKSPKKPFVLPGLAKRTAGVSTIDTVSHPGFAKGYAASRADTGSLVNALRGGNEPFVHHVEKSDGIVGSVPDSEDNLALHGYEDFYYTTLEMLKRKRLKDAYIGTFADHRRKRAQIVQAKIIKADKVKRNNLHADHLTATLLGLKRKEPIRIPTAQMDYDDDNPEYSEKPKTLKAVEQARKNIPGSFLNVWNMKLRDRRGEE